MTPPRQLVLASSSPYRRALLDRLGLPFITASPGLDESRSPSEAPDTYVRRLAQAKAEAVARAHPRAIVVGSDQTCVRNGVMLGKPQSLREGVEQLLAASGSTVRFLTALCVLDARDGSVQADVIPYSVSFRTLDRSSVERYLAREPALDSAGSFHAEGLGISLFDSMEGNDPTALIGLPLIALCRALRRLGFEIP